MKTERSTLTLDMINSPTLFKIIYLQKMTFEDARLNKDYDVMRSALQNILDNLITKANKEGKKNELANIAKALKWFDTIQYNKKYVKKLSSGETIHRYPDNLVLKVDYALSYIYRTLNKLIEDLTIE